MHECDRMASHLWPSARLSGDIVLPSTAGLVSEGCVREGCPDRTGARLEDAAIAATHSSNAGALREDACKAPHLTSHAQQCQVYSYENMHALVDVWSVMHADEQTLLCYESTVAMHYSAVLGCSTQNRMKMMCLVVQHLTYSVSKHASTLEGSRQQLDTVTSPECLKTQGCVMLFTVHQVNTPMLAIHLNSHALHLGFHSRQEGSPELVVVHAFRKALQDSCPEPEATAAYTAAPLFAHCLTLYCRLGLHQHSITMHTPT